MNEKSSQLVSYQVVRATIEAISKFTLLDMMTVPPLDLINVGVAFCQVCTYPS